jgi:hypothetical protein
MWDKPRTETLVADWAVRNDSIPRRERTSSRLAAGAIRPALPFALMNTTDVIAWAVVAIGLVPIVGKTLFAVWRLISR